MGRHEPAVGRLRRRCHVGISGDPTKPLAGDQTQLELHSPTENEARQVVIECDDTATLDAIFQLVTRVPGARVRLGKAGDAPAW